MQKFKLLILSTLFILPSTMFGIVGFGLNVIQDGSNNKIGTGLYEEGIGELTMQMETFEPENSPVGLGGYIFVDLAGWAAEYEYNFVGAEYKMNFSNPLVTYDGATMGWLRASTAITIKKNVADFSVPLLAKTALSIGVGTTKHKITPKASPAMIKELTGSEDIINDADFSEDALIEYLKNNLIEVSGLHAQLGLRFKILVIDAHLNLRYNIVENLYDGSDGYMETQFKLGMGF